MWSWLTWKNMSHYYIQCFGKLTYVRQTYFNGENIIPSREGVQQGDPLGPFLFALGICDMMKSCQSTLSLWYLDDGTLAGDPEDVLGDLAKIQEASDSLGLSVNPSKCEIFFTRKNLDAQAMVSQEVIKAEFETKSPMNQNKDLRELDPFGCSNIRWSCRWCFQGKAWGSYLNGRQIVSHWCPWCTVPIKELWWDSQSCVHASHITIIQTPQHRNAIWHPAKINPRVNLKHSFEWWHLVSELPSSGYRKIGDPPCLGPVTASLPIFWPWSRDSHENTFAAQFERKGVWS